MRLRTSSWRLYYHVHRKSEQFYGSERNRSYPGSLQCKFDSAF